MALAKVELQNDVSLKFSRPQLTSELEHGLSPRSRRATDVTGRADHDSEHDGRPHTGVVACD